jgi:TonB family protein
MVDDALNTGILRSLNPMKEIYNMQARRSLFKLGITLALTSVLLPLGSPVFAQQDKSIVENREVPAASSELKPNNATIVPAKMLQTGRLEYPKSMRDWGLAGTGLLEIIVNTEGRVKSVKTLESPHPAFEATVVRSALAATFSPSTVNGVPIEVRLRIPYSFQLEGRPGGDASVPFSFPKKPSDGLAAALQYDTPPTIKVVAPVVYPRDLLRANTTGSATVVARLDTKGRIVAVQVLEATHPDFGEATKAMIDAWEFKPAMKDNVAIENVFKIHQKFTRSEYDTGFSGRTYTLLDELNSRNSEVVEMDKLDAKPKLLYQPAPFDPVIPSESREEDVVIEFFIDPDGGVQLPHIVSAATPSRGWAAATAMKRWIFEVPKVGGKPVYVRRELVFVFN